MKGVRKAGLYKTERLCKGPSVERAVAYTRVSTEEQVSTGVSLDAQRSRVEAYCALAGLELSRVYREEGVSASKPLAERPVGSELVASVGSTIKHVIALKLDRLFRDAEDALHQTRQWDQRGVCLHLVDMGGQTLNTATAMGRFFLNMLAGFAELERNMISERTRTALSFKKANLKVYGPVPLGFQRSGLSLISDVAERKTVDLIEELRSNGLTLRAIADQLNRDHVRPKRGGTMWYASTVRYVLGNDIYREAA